MVVSQGLLNILRNIKEEILEISIRCYLEYDVCLVHCGSNEGDRKKEMSSELRDVSGGESVVSLTTGCTYFLNGQSNDRQRILWETSYFETSHFLLQTSL